MSARPTVRQLMRDEALRDRLRAADLVFAVDCDGNELLVHGVDIIDFVLSSGFDSQARFLRVAVDNWTDDLGLLAVLVRTAKRVELCDFETRNTHQAWTSNELRTHATEGWA